MTTATDIQRSKQMDTRNETMIKLALDAVDLMILRWQVDEAMSNKPLTCSNTTGSHAPVTAGRVQHDGAAAMNRSTSRITDDMFARIPRCCLRVRPRLRSPRCTASNSARWWCCAVGAAYRCVKAAAAEAYQPDAARRTAATQRPRVDVAASGHAGDGQGQHGTAGQRSLEKIASDGLYKAVLTRRRHVDLRLLASCC